jgi:type IV pilus assembly protein PilQ
MRRWLVTVTAVALASSSAVADRGREPAPEDRADACARGRRWRGHAIDLDVRDATITDVFRFLSDVGKVNVVVADDVAGKVTLRLKKVPWDQVLCTVAATKQLEVTRDGTVYMVRRR